MVNQRLTFNHFVFYQSQNSMCSILISCYFFSAHKLKLVYPPSLPLCLSRFSCVQCQILSVFSLSHRLFPFCSMYKFLSQYGISGGWLKGWSGDFQTKKKMEKKLPKKSYNKNSAQNLKKRIVFLFFVIFLSATIKAFRRPCINQSETIQFTVCIVNKELAFQFAAKVFFAK